MEPNSLKWLSQPHFTMPKISKPTLKCWMLPIFVPCKSTANYQIVKFIGMKCITSQLQATNKISLTRSI